MQILKLFSNTHFISMVYCIQKRKLKVSYENSNLLKFNMKTLDLRLFTFQNVLKKGISLAFNNLCHDWTFINPCYLIIYYLMRRSIRLRFNSNKRSVPPVFRLQHCLFYILPQVKFCSNVQRSRCPRFWISSSKVTLEIIYQNTRMWTWHVITKWRQYSNISINTALHRNFIYESLYD
jgi:hypothetical protein